MSTHTVKRIIDGNTIEVIPAWDCSGRSGNMVRIRGCDAIALDKPAGVSSIQALSQARRAFRARKAGHAGILDRPASGILAVAFGSATKTIPFVTEARKTYRFTVRFGRLTETYDAEGAVVAESASRPSDEDILKALDQFRGHIMQVPPKYSALKINGRRAHELARAGEDFEPEARPLRVHALEMLSRPDPDHAILEMTCGKGGYVRSIAHDLGQVLGCLGHASELCRIRVGPFREDNSLPLAALQEDNPPGSLDELLMPLEVGLSGLPELRCTVESAARLQRGNAAPVAGASVGYNARAWASRNGKAIATGLYRSGELHPKRVFQPH